MAKLNYRTLSSNVWEARVTLQEIEEQLMKDPKPNEVELQIQFEHAFHHLNVAWNARRISDKRFIPCNAVDFNQWSKFPKDIITYKVPLPRKRRQAKKADR
jgi:hypothetical protein